MGESDSDFQYVKCGYDASGLCDAFSIVICTLQYLSSIVLFYLGTVARGEGAVQAVRVDALGRAMCLGRDEKQE